MKVMTFNIWGIRGPQERQKVLLGALDDLRPEILCLQEVADPTLLSHLPYATRLHAPVGALAILSSFPVISHRKISYKTVSTLESYPRGSLAAQLETSMGPLWVVTTHLSWKAEDVSSRLGQIDELLGMVQGLADKVVIAGDLNAEPQHAPIQKLAAAGFVDLFSHLYPQEAGVTWDNQNPFIQSHEVRFPDRRIDYLFLRQGALASMHPEDCKVVCRSPNAQGLHPSDHYGVMATFADKAIGPEPLPPHRR